MEFNIGCRFTWFASMLPGILVPSAEQKQSGKTHWVGSQSGALLGSESTAKIDRKINIHDIYLLLHLNLLQAFSSDSSLQSGLPLQNSSLSTHSPFPQDSLPSGQTGSSVLNMGRTFLGSVMVIVL